MTKLDPTGWIVYSTYLGATDSNGYPFLVGHTWGDKIAVDSNGAFIVTGTTQDGVLSDGSRGAAATRRMTWTASSRSSTRAAANCSSPPTWAAPTTTAATTSPWTP